MPLYTVDHIEPLPGKNLLLIDAEEHKNHEERDVDLDAGVKSMVRVKKERETMSTVLG